VSTGLAPPNIALLPDTCPASSSGFERGCSFNRGRSLGPLDGSGLLSDVSRSGEESVVNTDYKYKLQIKISYNLLNAREIDLKIHISTFHCVSEKMSPFLLFTITLSDVGRFS